MTKLSRVLFFALISALFINCYSKKLVDVKSGFSVFAVQEQLNVADFFKTRQFTFDAIDLYKDSILVLINHSPSDQKHFFNFYNIYKKQILPGMLEMGRKDGQSGSFIFHGIEKNYIWVYDDNKEQIISLKMDSLHDSKVQRFIKATYFPWNYYSVQSINDTTFLANGNYDSPLDYKIAMINLNTGKPSAYMVPYSSDPSKPFKQEYKRAYQSFLLIRPLKDKVVNASRYTDQIEIVDIKTQQVKVVRGPEGFEPELEVVANNQGKRMAVRGARTRFAFLSGKVTNQFIYLLYSGNYENTSHRFYGSTIYVYDWNGKPVKKLSLKNDIVAFAVTANDSKIYVLNPATKIISVANLK